MSDDFFKTLLDLKRFRKVNSAICYGYFILTPVVFNISYNSLIKYFILWVIVGIVALIVLHKIFYQFLFHIKRETNSEASLSAIDELVKIVCSENIDYEDATKIYEKIGSLR